MEIKLGNICRVKEERIRVKDLEYRMISRGGGKPIILLHPFGYSVYTWRHIIDKFKEGYKAYAYDLKGFGNSDKPLHADYSLGSYARELIELMDAVGIEKAVLLGHALGGGIAIQAAACFPERFEKVILIDSLSYVIPNPAMIFRLMRIPVLGRFLISFNNAAMTKQTLREIFYNKALVTDELAEEYFRPFRDKGAANAFISVNSHCFLPERVRELEREIPLITQPTLVIWGQKDTWLSLDMAERLKRDISHSELFIIPECSHFPQEEKPEEVVLKINEFL